MLLRSLNVSGGIKKIVSPGLNIDLFMTNYIDAKAVNKSLPSLPSVMAKLASDFFKFGFVID